MKIFTKILSILAVAALTVSCSDLLDTNPEGSTLTSQQKAAIVEDSPELLSADIAGLAAGLVQYDLIGGGYHYDFGYASACIMMDSNTADMPCVNTGYNWYSVNTLLQDRIYNGHRALFMWNLFYQHIKTANDILALLPAEVTAAEDADPTLKAYRGQALASRAWDYLHLAQLYTFTYNETNKSLPCVPIVTEATTPEQAANNPRASLEDVYTLIKTDIDEAVTLLSGDNIPARADKGIINKNVALGIRARVNLVMKNYAAAATDAAAAREGFTLLSKEAVSTPSFNDAATGSSWMWANIITEQNRVVTSGILNWPSMLCSLTGNGYTSLVGCYKRIDVNLYNTIPATDVRKGWWTNAFGATPLVPAEDMASFDLPYINVKFGAYQFTGNATNACDWVMMRAEEMLLIEAEGLAMSSNTGAAKTLLENWVKTYRDPSYTCTASSATDLQNEIWHQRRIELWGEGHSFFDVMRLQKKIVRVQGGVSNFPEAALFNIEPTNEILLWRVPQREINANDGISEEDNPTAPEPKPGDGV